MWIRSQDKKALVNAAWFVVIDKCIKGDAAPWEHSFNLATYPTEARALEVLDEIQKQACNLEVAKLCPENCGMLRKDFVYQMPEK